jgi:DNA-binding PadR family transcriptional regulator
MLVLTALAAGPQHGYGIIKDVSSLSLGEVTLRVGTLYGALERLADDGLVELDHEEVVDSRLRRYYRLTEAGVNRLMADATRVRRQATIALRRLHASGAGA